MTSAAGQSSWLGDQHVLAEQLFFQGGAGSLVDAPGQAQVFRRVPVSSQVMTRRTQGVLMMAVISASTLSAGPPGLAAGQDSGQLV